MASFSYGHGNSDVQFGAILPTVNTLTGFHDISHLTDAASVDQLAAVDAWYCQQLAAFLMELKSTPETEKRVNDSIQLGDSLEVNATPTLFINGRKLAGFSDVPYETLKQLVEFEVQHAGR